MWTNLLYRTVMLIGLATDGDLWFERTDGSNNIVYARDDLELWQGAKERTLVTQTAVDTNVTYYTNIDWSWSGNDGTDTYVNVTWNPAVTNWLRVTNNYKLSVISTNVWTFTNENTTLVAIPETLDVFKWQTATNREKYIQGAWSNIVVSGFDETNGVDFTPFNSTYTFAFRTNIIDDGTGLAQVSNIYYYSPIYPDAFPSWLYSQFMADVYTNATYFFAVWDIDGWMASFNSGDGYDRGYIQRGSGAMIAPFAFGGDVIFKPRLDPIQPRSEWWGDDPESYMTADAVDTADISTGGLIPNMRRTMYSFDVDMQRNAFDDIQSMRKFRLVTQAGKNIYGEAIYVDHSVATNGEFVNALSIPTLNFTQVIGRLNISYPTNDDLWYQGTQTYLTNTLYSETNLYTRYAMLNYAKWTHADSVDDPFFIDIYHWESPYGGSTADGTPANPGASWLNEANNEMYGSGLETSDTPNDATAWGTAISRAQANMITNSSNPFGVDYELGHGTWGKQYMVGVSNYLYTARLWGKQAKISTTNMNANIDKTISFWFVTGVLTNWDVFYGVNYEYDDHGTGYVENRFNRANGVDYYVGYTNWYITPVLGSLGIPDSWCNLPTGTLASGQSAWSAKGWAADTLQMDQEWVATNANHYIYLGRGTTWIDAKVRAMNNMVTAERDDDVPMAGTYGKWDLYVTPFYSNYFEATAEWRESYIVHTNTDEIAGTADGYVNAGKYDYNGAAVGSQRTFHTNDTSLIDTNTLQRFSVGTTNVSGLVTSVWVAVGFSDSALPVWCDEPPANVSDFERSKGYQTTNSDIVVKWQFLYCTNSLP